MIGGRPLHPPDSGESAVELRKEAYTMALYVAICLLAALIGLPEADAHPRVIGIIWGVTIGIALAHWFAFRLSARLVGAGRVGLEDATSAAAQVAGAAAVALLASLAVILVPSPIELEVVELTLGGFLGVVGFTVARVGGATRPRAVAYFLSVLVFAVAVALVKNLLARH